MDKPKKPAKKKAKDKPLSLSPMTPDEAVKKLFGLKAPKKTKKK